MNKSLALGALLAFAGFTAALGVSTKFIIHTVPQAKSLYNNNMQSNSYYQPAPSPPPPPSVYETSSAAPPPPPPAYGQSSSSGGYASSGSSYADPTACSTNAECAAVDEYAECRYAKCQCKAPYVAENVGLYPITTMSMRSAVLDNRDATTVYLPPPMVNITCVDPFALLAQTCLIQTSCCLTADEQARLTAQSSCVVAPDPATLAAFNAPLPTASYATVGAPAGVLIDAATGSITTNASFVGPTATVTVQAVLSSSPAQVATTTVTLLVVEDPCCIRAPAQLQPQVTFDLYELLFDVYMVGLPVTDFVLIDFSGNTLPTFGASLGDLFTRPCDKPDSLVSATLAPTTAADDFCQFVVLNSNNQLVFQASATDPTAFSDALINAVISGTLDGLTPTCPINVTVMACSGVTLNATVMAAFPIPSLGAADLLKLMEKVPHRAEEISQIRKGKKQKNKL